MTKRNYIAIAIGCLALQSAIPAAAADEGCCGLRFTPYLWAMGLDGDIKVGPNKTNFSNDFSDIVDNMDIGGSGLFEYNKDRWVNVLQLDYLQLENKGDTRVPGVKADLEVDSTLGALATGYRFDISERSTVDLLVGVRYAKIGIDIDLQPGRSLDGDKTVVDGIVMLRPRFAITKYLSFSPTMSVGAGDSDLVWEMAPEFVYINDCCNVEFRAGYRSLNYQIDEGNKELDISIAGPMVGVGFAF
ncbi:MAG: hypothetical protein KBG75_00325 [Pseudomonadales bacterium]|nr:hypothetical protein [Pseudomonadales bacterium]